MSRMLLIGLFAGSSVLLLGQQLAARPLFTPSPAAAEAPNAAPGEANTESPADSPSAAPSTPASDRATSLLAATRPGDATRHAPGETVPTQTVLTRGETGGFELGAQINGHAARFVVDTGADLVSLTEADARRLGLPVDSGKMRPMLRTADGMADAQMLRIPQLTIGGQVMRDVPAVVVPGLQVNLLGESALSRLHRVTLSGNRMVIEPG